MCPLVGRNHLKGKTAILPDRIISTGCCFSSPRMGKTTLISTFLPTQPSQLGDIGKGGSNRLPKGVAQRPRFATDAGLLPGHIWRLEMKALKTLALAAVAVASLAATAEAGYKKHGFYFKPQWTTNHSHCWDYRKVAQPYYVKVAYFHKGKKRWKNVQKVRYVTKAFNICDVHHY
jgi:hypothetical protein